MVKKNNYSMSLYSPIDTIFNEIERRFDLIGHSSFSPINRFFDSINIAEIDCSINYPVSSCYIEENGNVVLEVAVTGFSKDEIDVSLENNRLTIKGESKKNENDSRKYLFRKLSKRDFDVSYELSNKLEFSKINVRLENGLLEVTIPKKEQKEKKIKKLPIK